MPRGPHGVHQLLWSAVLQQEPGGPRVESVEQVVVAVERGEDDDLGPGEPVVAGDAAGRREPVAPGHADVHQHDVGQRLDRLAHGLVTVGRLADDGDVRLGVEQGAEPGAHQRLVVGEQDGDHDRTGASTGRRARRSIMYLPASAECQLVPQAAMLMLEAAASSSSGMSISPR